MRDDKKAPALFVKRTRASCYRCTTHYCIPTYALPVTGETVGVYYPWDSSRSSGVIFGTGILVSGFHLLPTRCNVLSGLTFSVFAFLDITCIIPVAGEFVNGAAKKFITGRFLKLSNEGIYAT